MKNFFLNKTLFYIFIIFIIFFIDRISKLYILNIAETNQLVDIHINTFLNLTLVWNTGVGFGLLSLDPSIYYNLITVLIIFINIIILVIIIRSNGYKSFFFLIILGGSLGNLFDRVYYKAVPDFIDLHYNDFHWFIFNVADIFITLGVICLIFAEIFFKKTTNEN